MGFSLCHFFYIVFRSSSCFNEFWELMAKIKSRTKWLNPCSLKVPLKDFNGKTWAEFNKVPSTAFLWGHNWDPKWLVWFLILGFSLFRLSSLLKPLHNAVHLIHTSPLPLTSNINHLLNHPWALSLTQDEMTFRLNTYPPLLLLVSLQGCLSSVWLQWKNWTDTEHQRISFKGKTISVLSLWGREQITQCL